MELNRQQQQSQLTDLARGKSDQITTYGDDQAYSLGPLYPELPSYQLLAEESNWWAALESD